ncbi:hypothetical protein [Xanthobacter flavus]|uniref:hypothetical protein n=1 Tax=Xanthobacter flavus TaxID=281 RepID=UPI00372AB0A9
MLYFLTTVLEQLDLAQEHIVKGDVHNSRFGLMLTDNAVELVLHQIAMDKDSDIKFFSWKGDKFDHQLTLNKALGRNFEPKLKFARIMGALTTDEARSIGILHGFRNELYHAGLAHESILQSIAKFYFHIGSTFISSYRPSFIGFRSDQEIPERARKYISAESIHRHASDVFKRGCLDLASRSGHDAESFVSSLYQHMETIIDDQDTCIDIIATGVYADQRRTRTQAVIETQAWALAFSPEGRAFAERSGWNGSIRQLTDWLGANFPGLLRSDPISSWRRRSKTLLSQKDPNSALHQYSSFMTETERLREMFTRCAEAAEAEIDAAIDRMRGK